MAENTQNYEFESVKLVESEQFEVSTRLEAEENKPIKKVLSLKAIPKIVSSEKIGESVNFAGKTAYNVVYLSEDGTLKSIYADAEWHGKINSPCDSYYLKCSEEESQVTGSSRGEITISSLNNIYLYGIQKEVVSSVEGLGEDYVSELKTHEQQRVVSLASGIFNEVLEEETSGKFTDVLTSSCEVVLENAVANIDTVTVSGRAFVKACLVENNKIVEVSKTLEFKEELQALSVVPANVVDASVCLSGLKVSATVSEIDNKTNLIFAVELQANAAVLSKENVTVVEDAFSLKKEIVAARECILSEVYEGEDKSEEFISSSFETGVELDEILAVTNYKCASCETTSQCEGDFVSGWAEVEYIALSNGEMLNLKGTIPFSVKNESGATENTAHIKSISLKLKGKGEVETALEIVVLGKKRKSEFVSFIRDIEETEDKSTSDATIRVYVTNENEDMFAVAKKLNMRPEDILEQNPNAQEGLGDGTRLVVYSPLGIKFE